MIRLAKQPRFVLVDARWCVLTPPMFVGATATIKRKLDGKAVTVLLDDLIEVRPDGSRLYRLPAPDPAADADWEADIWDDVYRYGFGD